MHVDVANVDGLPLIQIHVPKKVFLTRTNVEPLKVTNCQLQSAKPIPMLQSRMMMNTFLMMIPTHKMVHQVQEVRNLCEIAMSGLVMWK